MTQSFKYTTFEKSNVKGKFLEKNIDLFWNEYLSGHVKKYYRSDDISKLVSPFYNCIENKVFQPYYELCNGTRYLYFGLYKKTPREIYQMLNTFIIGEIGINHNGDINMKKLIDYPVDMGCDRQISKKNHRCCV